MNEPDSQDPMGEATAIRGAAEPDYLRGDEIGPAIEALSADDKLKLGAIETILRRGTGLGQDDLVHEAFCRALLGRRNCPRGVPFMAFLVETMKSIASHARDRRKRLVAVADPPQFAQADASGAPLAPSPEDEAAASMLRAIRAHLEDDEEATMVLMGWDEGLRGKALREAAGLDQAALDYAAKRIRTIARKLYPDGWKT